MTDHICLIMNKTLPMTVTVTVVMTVTVTVTVKTACLKFRH